MNNELDKQLASLVEAAKRAGSDVASFIQQQAPEFIEQLLAWRMADSIAGILFFGTITTILIWYARKRFKSDEEDFSMEPPGFVAALLAVMPLIPTAICFMNLVKVLVAPKLVVLEMISDLLK